MATFFDIRAEERRTATLAFLALLGITAAHTLIETARDALFLSKVPIAHLPALYLAIAAAGLATTRAGAALEARRANAERPSGLDPVSTSLLGAAAITTGFWLAAASPSRTVLYALYIYSGLFASWVAGRLWIRLSTIFTVVQAKRLYGLIGTGAVLGAVLGAGAARASLAFIEVRHLLIVGAVLLGVTAVGPTAMLPRPLAVRRENDGERAATSLGSQVGEVGRHPYLVRVLAIVLVTSVVGTAIDFVFKSEVKAHFPNPRELASFLASVALITNVASFIAQSVGVGLMMRILGVQRALYVMPLFIAFGGAAAVLGLGFGAAIAMRGIDGSLRYSLQKTCTELLFVPLPDALRARCKPIIDLIGQRGGQAVTSVAILGLVYVVGPERSTRSVGIAVVVLTVGWLAVARGIRSRYLDVFRSTLRRGRLELSSEMPELDITALEALIASLSSRRDAQVLGALDLLAAQARGRLIPSLILFHPTKAVVLRALELLAEQGRSDFVPVADRLLDHADAEVRAAALRARASVEPDVEFLRARLEDPQDEIRATALVALIAHGNLPDDDANTRLDDLSRAAPESRRALARALGEAQQSAETRRSIMEQTLLRLAADDDTATRSLAAISMGHYRTTAFVPALIRMLEERNVGLLAIEALAEMGDAAVSSVDEALDDSKLAEETKWRLLRVLSRSRSRTAVPRLAQRLEKSQDVSIRTRILRALRGVQTAGLEVPVDTKALSDLAKSTIVELARALAFRLAHSRLIEETPTYKTSGAELLQKLLLDQEAAGTERLFLLLGLLHPRERFTRIQRGLASTNPKQRASSNELIENVVRAPLRDSVLAVVDDGTDRERLLRLGAERVETQYEALLAAMVAEAGDLGVLAVHHAREVGCFESVRTQAEQLDAKATAFRAVEVASE